MASPKRSVGKNQQDEESLWNESNSANEDKADCFEDEMGVTPLSSACENGHLEVAIELLNRGAAIDKEDGMGFTPLSRACENSHLEVAIELLNRGATIDKGDRMGVTPLSRACENGHLEVAIELLNRGAAIDNDRIKVTPLSHACDNGHLEVAIELLNRGATIDKGDLMGRNVLHNACFGGHWDVINYLMHRGLSVTDKDKNGRTPLDELKSQDDGLSMKERNDRRLRCLQLLQARGIKVIDETKPIGKSLDDSESDKKDSITEEDTGPSNVTEDKERLLSDPAKKEKKKQKQITQIISDDLFVKAIDEGKGQLKPAVVIMHGPPGAGKTSVKQLLLGQPPLTAQEQNSTGIMERPIRMCRLRSSSTGKLSRVNKSEFHELLLDNVLAHTTELNDKQVTKTTKEPFTKKQVKDSRGSKNLTTPSKAQTLTSSHIHDHPQPSASYESSSTLRIIKERLPTGKASHDLFDLDWIHLVDSGGQPQFTDVLPRLFQSEALYIVVIRLDKDLNDKPKSCYCQNGVVYTLPDSLMLTNRELIERACQVAESQNSEASPKRVMIIGTHVDKLKNAKETLKHVNTELLKIHEKYEKVLVPKSPSSGEIIFALNAMATGDERQLYTDELQQCVLQVVKRSTVPKDIPLKWFVYEFDLDEASEETSGVISKSTCIKVGETLGMAPKEIELSLKYFSQLALHLYYPEQKGFPDLVLIKMDPLTDRLSTLIRKSFEIPKSAPTFGSSKLKKFGLFSKSFLAIAFEDISDEAISNDDFLCILECLKVVVHVRGEEYFIPSALSVSSSSSGLTYSSVKLVLDWKEQILPPSFFFTLIVELLQAQDEQSDEHHFTFPPDNVKYEQSRNRIHLCVESYVGVVTLTDEQRWIGVYYTEDNVEYYTNILKVIIQSLDNVVELTGIKFPGLGFVCPMCGTTDHPCSLTKDYLQCKCSFDPCTTCDSTDTMRTILGTMKPLTEKWKMSTEERKRRDGLVCKSTLKTEQSQQAGSSKSNQAACKPAPDADDTILGNDGLTLTSLLRETKSIADWNILSLLLGIEDADVDRIRQNNPGAALTQQMAILKAWLNKGQASWAVLVGALRDDLIGRAADGNRIAKAHPRENPVQSTLKMKRTLKRRDQSSDQGENPVQSTLKRKRTLKRRDQSSDQGTNEQFDDTPKRKSEKTSPER